MSVPKCIEWVVKFINTFNSIKSEELKAAKTKEMESIAKDILLLK